MNIELWSVVCYDKKGPIESYGFYTSKKDAYSVVRSQKVDCQNEVKDGNIACGEHKFKVTRLYRMATAADLKEFKKSLETLV